MIKSEINQKKSESAYQVKFRKTDLKEKCKFDNLVIGDCNKMAQEASVYVSKYPGKEYNPLFIWGDTGLGKTHLLYAIKDYMNEFNPENSVLFVDAQWFTKEVVHSIRYGIMKEFREKYRTVDVLLLDNIQHIIGKKSTQEEFFHTFNSLFDEGRQIVITGNKPPKEMDNLDEKFRSRLSCGLIVDIQLPDNNTKKEFIRITAQQHHIKIDNEAVSTIALSVTNIAELKNILNRFFQDLGHSNEGITIESATRVIDKIKQSENKISANFIINKVAEYYKITSEDILSTKKSKEVLYPRQIAMYLCGQMTNESFNSIGKIFGRNHSTIKNGINKIEMQQESDSEISKEIENIKKML